MPKKAVRNRNDDRKKLSIKMRSKREQLRAACSNIHLDMSERMNASRQLQDLPRDSSPTRCRNRCKVCGRPRAYNRLTGLCRLHMRLATVGGMVPGMHKASW